MTSRDSLFSLDGKVVLITGGGRGNGATISQAIADRGARVFTADIQFSGPHRPDVERIQCDLADEKCRVALLDVIKNKADCLDVLVNNAGISLGDNDPYSIDVFHRTVEVNALAPMRLSRLATQLMIHGGSIINITSLGSELGFPNNPSYQASKAALRQLTKAMALDFAPLGIRVNNICPGYIRTAMTERSFSDSNLKSARDARMILGRWGESSDLVGACIFLATEASSYVTGSDIHVDGGWTAKGL